MSAQRMLPSGSTETVRIDGGMTGDQIRDYHSGLPLRQPHIVPVGWIEQTGRDDPQIRIAIIDPILNIIQEMVDHRDRDDMPDILRCLNNLESDPHDLFILENRATAVPRVDGGVDLEDEVIIPAGMAVASIINPGDDTPGDRDPPAAGRKSIDQYQRTQLRDLLIKRQRGGVLEERGVEDVDQRQVTVMSDKRDHSPVGGAALLFLNLQIL